MHLRVSSPQQPPHRGTATQGGLKMWETSWGYSLRMGTTVSLAWQALRSYTSIKGVTEEGRKRVRRCLGLQSSSCLKPSAAFLPWVGGKAGGGRVVPPLLQPGHVSPPGPSPLGETLRAATLQPLPSPGSPFPQMAGRVSAKDLTQMFWPRAGGKGGGPLLCPRLFSRARCSGHHPHLPDKILEGELAFSLHCP